MRCALAAIGAVCHILLAGVAAAEPCAGNAGAIGTSRTLVVDPREHGRVGSVQYPETLPLDDKEVVLTFDDGPLPHHTQRVLETLANECVKATFFMVGRMAQAYPEWVRKVHDAGHTIGTHTENHPRFFRRLDLDTAAAEIRNGIAATQAALGETRALAPFFRFPGLQRNEAAEQYLAGSGLMIWGVDVPADDWMHITPAQVIGRALHRLEQKGRGILLLHDIQAVTTQALPELLQALKARGYRIVHVAPAAPDRPATATSPLAWLAKPARLAAAPASGTAPAVAESPAARAARARTAAEPAPGPLRAAPAAALRGFETVGSGPSQPGWLIVPARAAIVGQRSFPQSGMLPPRFDPFGPGWRPAAGAEAAAAPLPRDHGADQGARELPARGARAHAAAAAWPQAMQHNEAAPAPTASASP